MSRTQLILVVLITGFIFSGCTTLFKKKIKVPEIFQLDVESLAPDQFPEYIAQLEKITRESSNSSTVQKSHLLIAEASIYHTNPAPNYDLALKEFEEYLKLEPESPRKYKILDWIALLRELKQAKNEINIIIKRLTTQVENNQIQKENLEKQKKEIIKLKLDIKKLDSLYFSIEKKKKKKNINQ